MVRIPAIKKHIDELTYEQYEFILISNSLYLDRYYIYYRENLKKRAYKVIKYYDRISERSSTLLEEEVPFNEAIKAEALQVFIDSIKCRKWSERQHDL